MIIPEDTRHWLRWTGSKVSVGHGDTAGVTHLHHLPDSRRRLQFSLIEKKENEKVSVKSFKNISFYWHLLGLEFYIYYTQYYQDLPFRLHLVCQSFRATQRSIEVLQYDGRRRPS